MEVRRDLTDQMIFENLPFARVKQYLAACYLLRGRRAEIGHRACLSAERDSDDEEAVLDRRARLVLVRKQGVGEPLDVGVNVPLDALPRPAAHRHPASVRVPAG